MTRVVTQLDWGQSPRYDDEMCPFCNIVRGRAPAEVVHSWPEAIAIEPLNPVAPGHIIVIPVAHVRDFIEDPALSASISHRVIEVAHMIHDHDTDVNIITSIGAYASQTVYHLHVHIVPRKEDDGLKLPWTEQAG